MQPILQIKVARDFSSTPGPRYRIEGDNSGEEFRDEYLVPLLRKAIDEKSKVEIDLDGTEGFATSFLEESFGGLIRHRFFDYESVISTISIVSNEEPYLQEDIEFYLKDANKSLS